MTAVRVVNLSSAFTRLAIPDTMTKGSIDRLTRVLARALGPREASSNRALDGVGRPADVADIVFYLVSYDAQWSTGQTFYASGISDHE